MDFRFTSEQERLKNEFEGFCKEEAKRAPEGWIGGLAAEETDEGWAYHQSVVNKVAAKGWLCLPWPKEYGGHGHGPVEQLIFNEVTAYYRVPALPFHFMTVAAGIMVYGTEEQKKEWLPKIAKAEINWAEGLSEPNAGSDLASLNTTAVEDGDDYVINGQKVWTSGAHRSDHIFILARTDSKESRHKGLTFFINEIGPGIEFRPLIFMNRSHFYNETFIEDFRVPKKNIVGKVNQGWYVMMAGRNFARANISFAAAGKRDLEDLIEYCKQTHSGNQVMSKNPLIRQKLAEFSIDFEAALKFAYYISWLQSKGQDVAAEAAACGYFSSELNLRLANTAVEIMGLYGTIKRESKWAPLYGKFQDLCQWGSGFTIAGGTTEIRKNVIAWIGLKLPRG
ncbi:MAG: acyl-CoA dehydrogenase family protein [Thermodesulfobacteriota bacterium]|nr:acyl-CoA dehydrogenase family protein [Thermodesulfobacteriota bacterium]